MLWIPNKERKEWRKLVTGNLVVSLNNFFLRTKVEQIIAATNRVKLTEEEAISAVYDLCIELSETRDITEDIEAIFGKSDKKIKKITKEEVGDAQPIDVEDKVDVSSRIERIMQDARKKSNFVQEESFDENLDEANKAVLIHLPEKKHKDRLVLELEPMTKDVSLEKERLRQTSIERSKKGGFLRSIFNQ